MQMQEIDSLRALLPRGRTLFPYFKDKYSLQLLRYALPRPTAVAALRGHAAAQLLQKPALRALLAGCGGMLDRATVDAAWLPGMLQPEHYTLSLGVWGNGRWRAAQTSRRGANLVLQLNFNHGHNRAFGRLVRPHGGEDPFNAWGHPALRDPTAPEPRYTLAWARLDVDFERGEALIEELQTDWLRRAARVRDNALRLDDATFARRYQRSFGGSRADVVAYHDRHLAPHRPLWDEALLAATLFFLREELGIADIWMHTPRSGVLLKDIRHGTAPPVSVYSSLPQRFCFRPGTTLPAFLAADRSVLRRLRRAEGVQLLKFSL